MEDTGKKRINLLLFMIHLNQACIFGETLQCCEAMFDRVAALVRSHMNGLKSFERTIEQTTQTMPLALKQ